jgi:hypothetical protein
MSITKDFSNGLWYEAITGTGTITVGDGGSSVSISSPAGSSARSRYYAIALPGEQLTFSVMARNIPNGLSGFAACFIDIPINTLQNTQAITSEDLQVYTVSAVVPSNLVGPQKIAFGVGSYSALDGSAEFINPVITRAGSHVVMEGFIQFADGGGWTLREDYLNYNVGDIAWNDSDKTLLIKPSVTYDFSEISGTNQFRPTLLISGSPDGNTTEVYSWTGSNTNSNGWCKIQACTHALAPAVPVNLSNATNQTRFCGFRLVMVGDG